MRSMYADPEHWTTINLMPWAAEYSFDNLGACKSWCVTGVQVSHRFRGQGHAARLLDAVIADAEAEGVLLTLYIVPDESGGLDYNQLREFYTRHGFVTTDEDNGEMQYTPSQHVAEYTAALTDNYKAWQGLLVSSQRGGIDA